MKNATLFKDLKVGEEFIWHFPMRNQTCQFKKHDDVWGICTKQLTHPSTKPNDRHKFSGETEVEKVITKEAAKS